MIIASPFFSQPQSSLGALSAGCLPWTQDGRCQALRRAAAVMNSRSAWSPTSEEYSPTISEAVARVETLRPSGFRSIRQSRGCVARRVQALQRGAQQEGSAAAAGIRAESRGGAGPRRRQVRRRGWGRCRGRRSHIADESVGEAGRNTSRNGGAGVLAWDMSSGASGETRSPGVQRPRPVTVSHRLCPRRARSCAADLEVRRSRAAGSELGREDG